MTLSAQRRVVIETVALAAASLLFYRLGFLLFLFMVPLQVLYLRRGAKPFLSALVGVFLGFVVMRVVQIIALSAELERVNPLLLSADLVIPLGLLGGIALVNLQPGGRLHSVYRVLLAAGLLTALTAPIVWVIGRSPELLEAVITQFEQVYELVRETAGDAGAAMPQFEEGEFEPMFLQAVQVLLRTYVFAFTVLLLANWFIGNAFAGTWLRNPGALHRFEVPNRLLWPSLLAWAGALATRFVGLGAAEYVVWNFGLICVMLYAVQGLSIMRFLFDRYGFGRVSRAVILGGMILMLFMQGLNVVLVIGIALLGVSENWVEFNRFERSGENL